SLQSPQVFDIHKAPDRGALDFLARSYFLARAGPGGRSEVDCGGVDADGQDSDDLFDVPLEALEVEGDPVEIDAADEFEINRGVAVVAGFAEATVFRGPRVAGPVAMNHRLVNVSEGEVTDLVMDEFQIPGGKPASFADEVIRPGVQEQNMGPGGLKFLDDLPD